MSEHLENQPDIEAPELDVETPELQVEAEPAQEAEKPKDAPKKKKKKKKKFRPMNVLIIGAFALFFTVGLIVLLYPTISNYVNNKNQSRVMGVYRETVAHIDETDYASYMDAAAAYNAALASEHKSVTDAFVSVAGDEEQTDEYWSLLSVDGNRVMGYIEIEDLNIHLPIYHGTSETVLTQGAGHLYGTSLPVGGESTHTVISAHTGLPSGKFFDSIDQMKLGDTFTVFVMNEILTYQVDQILVVLPEEIDALSIEMGRDLATLITCTPYGINSHRLLVRGTRIETPPQKVEEHQQQITAIEQPEELGFFANIGNAVVTFLANLVENVAQVIVNISQWVMSQFGVAY